MGSLAVNLSGFIDMMTVTGRLDDVMNTAPQALLSGFGELIPQIEVTNQTVHNYLYGAYTGKAEVIANLVPALTAGLAVSALPAVAESFARNNRLRTQKSVQMVLRMTAIICIPAGLGISVLSEEIDLFCHVVARSSLCTEDEGGRLDVRVRIGFQLIIQREDMQCI